MTDFGNNPLWLRGITQFNGREFFQCHESWEALWRQSPGPERLFLKGLIQAAVALFHLDQGNAHGARKLLAGAQKYLTPYGPIHAGLDVETFLCSVTLYVTEALTTGEGSGRPRGEFPQPPQIPWPPDQTTSGHKVGL